AAEALLAAGPAAVGQADQALGGVVVLVRLEEVFPRVDGHPVDEAAAQAGDVDPLLVVGGRVDVRPADRGAQLDPVLEGVLVAARVDAAAGRAAAGPGAGQVPQAVVELGAGADDPADRPIRLCPQQFEGRQLVDLPIGAAEVGADVGEAQLRFARHGDVTAALPVDPLVGPHAARAVAVAAKLHWPGAAALHVD